MRDRTVDGSTVAAWNGNKHISEFSLGEDIVETVFVGLDNPFSVRNTYSGDSITIRINDPAIEGEPCIFLDLIAVYNIHKGLSESPCRRAGMKGQTAHSTYPFFRT